MREIAIPVAPTSRSTFVCGLVCGLLFGLMACSEPTESAPSEALSNAELTPEQIEEIAALEALGYIEGDQPAPAEKNVTLYERGRAWDGLNLYTSEHAPEVYLMDMEGRVLHTWRVDVPDLAGSPKLRRVQLFENGELMALMEHAGLARVTRDSQILWTYRGRCHHDFEIQSDGRIYVLTKKGSIYPKYNRERPILDDFITVLSSDGEVLQKVSLVSALERSDCCAGFLREGMSGDAFHSNTVVRLDGRWEARHPAFREGNVLTSWRHLDAIGVIDLDAQKVVWKLDGVTEKQHHPTILENGNLLIFDNYDTARGEETSRVIEIDPFTKEIVWEFHGSDEFPFFTRTGGTNQLLPNGNVLITETRNGRAFEVTRAGEVVWIFRNPARVGKNSRQIARMYEVQRIAASFVEGWLR